MIDNAQFREFIIRPALNQIKMYSVDAEELLVATLAHESLGCSYLAQVGGDACGPYMVQKETYKSALCCINRDFTLRNNVYKPFGYTLPPPIEVLRYNLRFATIIARIIYHMVNKPLPLANNIDDIWQYYKTYYNTVEGSATKEAFISNYRRFIGAKDEEGIRPKRGTSGKA